MKALIELLKVKRAKCEDPTDFDFELADAFDLWTFGQVLEHHQQQERRKLRTAPLNVILKWGIKQGACAESLRLELFEEYPEIAEAVRILELEMV